MGVQGGGDKKYKGILKLQTHVEHRLRWGQGSDADWGLGLGMKNIKSPLPVASYHQTNKTTTIIIIIILKFITMVCALFHVLTVKNV